MQFLPHLKLEISLRKLMNLIKTPSIMAAAMQAGVEEGLLEYVEASPIRTEPLALDAITVNAKNARISIDQPSPSTDSSTNGFTEWMGTAIVETFTKDWLPMDVLVGPLSVNVEGLGKDIKVNLLQLVLEDGRVNEVKLSTL